MTARRAVGGCALVAIVCSIGMTVAPKSESAQAMPKPRAQREGNRPDTVVVFGPKHYVRGSSGTWTVFAENPSIANFDSTRRFIFRISNGDAQGQNRVSQVSLLLNGTELMNTSDVTTSVPFAIKVATPKASSTLQVSVSGATNAFIDLDLISTPDPSYALYGPTRFTVPQPPPDYQVGDPLPPTSFTRTFNRPSTAAGPYTLVLANGAADGSLRTAAELKLNGTWVVNDLTEQVARLQRQVALLSSNSFTIKLEGDIGTYANVSFTATDTTAPVVSLTGPADGFITDLPKVGVAGSVADETHGTVAVNGQTAFATPGTFSDSVSLAADGRYTITVHAANSAGYGTDVIRTVIRDTRAPDLTVSQPTTPTTSDSVSFSISWNDSTTTTTTVDGDTVGTGMSGNLSYKVSLDLGPNGIYFKATDAIGHSTSFKRYVFKNAINEPTARDSGAAVAAAGALSPAEITGFLNRNRFLYTGSTPLQTGVVPDSVIDTLAAVVHGQVTSRDFGPLPNVTVSVLGQPWFGQTITRADGRFDMVVNGGSRLTMRFKKPGYLEAQRAASPLPNDDAVLDSMAMLGKTSRQTVVDYSAPQVARGRFQTDGNGDRDVRMYFQQGTAAKVAGVAGDTATFGAVRTRATEYTVGSDGRNAMPGLLPPSSAYTYCVDLSLAEADSAATSTGTPYARFTRPVACYVRNFLHLPVGTNVPSGSYDSKSGQWKAGADGCTIRILSVAGGSAVIDSKGNGVADGQSRLDSLGVDAAELTRLAQQYAANDTIWRVTVDHFSTWDFNINLALVTAQQSPTAGRAGQPLGIVGEACTATGSIIECENRVLGESIPIVGTPFSLNYRSYRALGDAAIRTLRIPVVGATVPSGLQRIVVLLDVAGRRFRRQMAPAANLVVTIDDWEGNDAFGRRVQGSVSALVQVGYQYASAYGASAGGSSLGDPASTSGTLGPPGGDRSVGQMSWIKRRISLGAPSTGSDGLGGWTISPHHFYDMTGRGALYLGDGTVVLGERNYPVIRSLSNQISATDVAVTPSGRVFAAAGNGIWEVGRGDLKHVVGGGTSAPANGLPAASVNLDSENPLQVAVGPDGSIYFALTTHPRVCTVTPDGILHFIAGTGQSASAEVDGGLATQTALKNPTSIALGPDGSVYVGDFYGNYATVRRIAPNGIITRYAGNDGTGSPTNDQPGKATTIWITDAAGMCVDGVGNLYIAEGGQYRVRKVAPDGTMTTAANGSPDPSFTPNDVAVGPDGAVYFSTGAGESHVKRIHRLDPDGSLSVVVGGGPLDPAFGADGIPALGSYFNKPQGIAFDQSGNIVIAVGPDPSGGAVRRVAPDLPGANGGEFALPSQDGSEVYFFNLQGQHLRTRDALTGGVRYRFTYDGAGRLATIVDANNDVTTIERDANGNPTGILAPYGQHTVLTTVARNTGVYLATVADPAGETVTLDPDDSGLLRTFKDAKNNTHAFTFASDGRLNVDADPAGGSQTLPPPAYSGFARTVTRTTGESRQTSYTVTDLFDGTRQRRIIGPDGLLRYASDSTDARRRSWFPEGLLATDSLVREPRFGMLAPTSGLSIERLPSGIARTVEVTRPPGTGDYQSGFNPPFATGQWTEQTLINHQTSYPPFQTVFDAAQHTVTSTTPLGRQATTTVDSLGRPLQIAISGLAPIQFVYSSDNHGRLTQLSQGGRTWQYAYSDGLGRLTSITDALGRITSLAYDNADRVTAHTMPDSQVAAFAYDANGNLTSVTPPGRPAHAFDYTAVDLTQHYTPPDAGIGATATTYSYNKDRQLTQLLRPGNAAVTLAYETSSGRLSSVTTPRGTSALSYDAGTGQLSTLTSPDGVTLTYAYDGPLPTTETWSGTMAGHVDVTYDRDFRASRQTINGANTVDLAYDADGLQTGAGVLSMHRNATGLLDSTSLGGFTATSSQDFNSHGETANLHYAWSGGSYTESVARDTLGRIVGRTEAITGDTTRTVTFVYTTAGRLKEMRRGGDILEHYEYDANGNRVFATGASLTDTATALYDAQDRLLRYRNTRYSYTAAGELSQAVTGSATTSYTYDALGNLVTVVLPGGDRIDYVIDGRNRRVGRKLNGVLQKGWLYQNDLNPEAELDATGNVTARYVYGSSDHVPDYVEKGGATYRLVTDHLGSVRFVVNASTGAVAERIDYDAWGRVLGDTSPGFVCFGYEGGLTDPVTPLLRFGARDYDPRVGRWTSRDPLILSDEGSSEYAFATGDPVNEIDPTGMSRLLFSRAGGYIEVYPDAPHFIGPPTPYPASNNARNPNADPYAPGAYGPVPLGVFPMGPVIYTGADPNSSYGTGFIPIYLPRHNPYASARPGVGVHSGRANTRRGFRFGTLGCIRTTEDALNALRRDPPTIIEVRP